MMSEKEFIERVKQNRFVVQQITPTRFNIYSIEKSENSNTFYLYWWANPDTKSGCWNAKGGGYSKDLFVLEQLANKLGKDAHNFLMQKQNFNTI